jgi:catechol 2,3-dioxygenase-like lactoylglutathione lyase family enzyme
VISSLAHSAICVPDMDEAVRWYSEVLGLKVLSPPYRMEGPSIERDMGELVPAPVAVEAAILGFDESDHVVELISYPNVPLAGSRDSVRSMTDPGISHLGLLCDDVARTRAELEANGVRFLTSEPAKIAGLRTTWFCDPWGAVWILLEKRFPRRSYWRQFPLPADEDA